ncbi:MAG TPA: heparan-alpha-glucosaminide N-acetyltransferase domain-containing protein [Longimicrobium sp.]|jgi:predicted acyltransferase|uniref:acyltransferase family protein n=1 Tax=Longimicrobium sp. TaxID=2029185 RepID=UPI002EDA8820
MSDTLAATRPLAPAIEPAVPPRPERLVSLDVFRGATVAAMLLVNNPGTWSAVYDPLEHAAWHGWTPTDLIFPFFLFIVGVSMAFSLLPRLEAGDAPGRLFARAAKRSAILVLLGLLLTAFPYYNLDLAHLRLPGVLQRIGLAFLLASAVVLFTRHRAQIGITAALLLGYWAAMMLVSVPGYGAGDLGKDGNLAAYVDRAVLGTDHLWKSAKTWDPEGLLSTLPAVATVLLGVFAGRWMRSPRSPADRLVGLFLAGTAAVTLGWMWNEVFPINKALWTSSYVLLTAGLALHALAVCYWMVDVRGWRRWAGPFVWFGMNAIAAFFLSGIVARLLGMIKPGGVALKQRIFDTAFDSWLPAHDASLAFALCFVALFTGLMGLMYRRQLFIKV